MVSHLSTTPYFGGKHKKLKWILPLLKTEYNWFIEPFCGSAAVSLNMVRPGRAVFCSDANEDVVNMLRCLRNEPEAVAEFAMLYPASPAGLADAGVEVADTGKPPAQRAAAMFCALRFSRGANLGDGIPRSSFGRTTNAPPGGLGLRVTTKGIRMQNTLDKLPAVVKALRQIEFFHCDYREAFERYDREGALFYCDPPYLGETRQGGGYLQDAPGAEWHEEFLGRCLALKGKCAVSGYASDLYSGALKDWRREELETFAMAGITTSAENRKRTEVLWMNYPAPQKEIW